MRSTMKGGRMQMGVVIFIGFMMGLVVSAQEKAVPDVDARVDAFVGEQLGLQRIPGVNLAVLRYGKLVKAKGYGLANLELDVPVKPATEMQTGSVGKQFTATAVMMLVEEGKVGLDDDVSKYFAGTPVAWKDIKVRNLLTHTSGIPEYTDAKSAKAKELFNFRADYTEDDLYQRLIQMPLDFEPGTKWKYSNSGYLLLGILIHKVTGEFYGDFLQERIFRPLGMTATRIISEADIVPNRSSGYRIVNGEIKNQEWVSPTLNTTADGALYTNVLDLGKWDAALYTEKLIKRSSLEQMWTPVRLKDGKTYPYGFGWFLNEVNGHRLIEHDGAWQGFTVNISRYVDDRLTVIVMTNLEEGPSEPGKIAHGVAGIYEPELNTSKKEKN